MFSRGVVKVKRNGDGEAFLSVVDGARLSNWRGRGQSYGRRAGDSSPGIGWIEDRLVTGGKFEQIFAD